MSLTLTAKPALDSTTAPEDASDERGLSIPIIVTGSVLSAAGFAAGVGLLVTSTATSADAGTIADELGGMSSCASLLAPAAPCAEIDELAHHAAILQGGAVAAIAVGSALLAGTLTYVFWPRGEAYDRAQANQPT